MFSEASWLLLKLEGCGFSEPWLLFLSKIHRLKQIVDIFGLLSKIGNARSSINFRQTLNIQVNVRMVSYSFLTENITTYASF